MGFERGGVYLETGKDVDLTPIIKHVDDLTPEERAALLPPVVVPEPPARETRGGLYVDAPDDASDPDTARQPPKHIDDMTPQERESRLGQGGG